MLVEEGSIKTDLLKLFFVLFFTLLAIYFTCYNKLKLTILHKGKA